MAYLQHQKFIQDICDAITEFMNDILQPAECIVTHKKPISFQNFQFCLCYLTQTPNTFQDLSSQYGKSILESERANPANLPRLNRPEVSLLNYYGLANALTLHPYSLQTKSYVPILTLDIPQLLPQEHQLKTIATLFLMAIKKSPLQKPIPVLAFGCSESNQISSLGFCGGHRFCGIINGGGNKSSVGYGDNVNISDIQQQVIRALAVTSKQETIGAFPIPVVSRYFESTTRDLYSKNSENIDYVVQGEERQQIQQFSGDKQITLADLNYLIKSYKPQLNNKQLQYLHSDKHGNIFLNCYDMPANNINNQSPAMSRYIRSFPSLLFGPLAATSKEMYSNIARCWEVFNHLPRQAKARGVAVESLVLHQFTEEIISSQQFMAVQTKLIEQYIDQVGQFGSYAIFPDSGEEAHMNQIQSQIAQDFCVLRSFIENHGTKMLLGPHCLPTASMLKALMVSIHFGTAAIGSFVDDIIDIEEAMVWAFSLTCGQAQPTALIKQLADKIDNIGKSAPFLYNYNEKLYQDMTAYVMSKTPGQNREIAELENSQFDDLYQLYNHKNRFCNYNCIFCRMGDMIASLVNFSDSINYIKHYFSVLGKHLSQQFEEDLEVMPIDVMRDSIVYQKYYQAVAFVNAKRHFAPYIPSTYDQTMRLYMDVESGAAKQLSNIENSKIFVGIEYYYLEYLQFNQTAVDSEEFLVQFLNYLESKNKVDKSCVPYKGKPINQDISEALQKIVHGKPLFYPYDNCVILWVTRFLLQQYQLLPKPINVEQKKQQNKNKITEGFDTLIQVNCQFLMEMVEPQYVYALGVMARLHKVYTQDVEVIVELQHQLRLSQLLIDQKAFDLPENFIVKLISPEAEFQCYIHEQILKCSVLNKNQLQEQLNRISAIEQQISRVYLVRTFFKLSHEDAAQIIKGFCILEGSERQNVYQMFINSWLPVSWELVLHTLQPGIINHLPHRFYLQFLGAKTEKYNFIPQFQHLISATIVETIPYGAFDKK